MNKTLYEILEISPSSNQEEIKKAFKKLAKKYHPDMEGGDESKFKEINDAYDILSDETKKYKYDISISKKDNSSYENYTAEDIYDILRREKNKYRQQAKATINLSTKTTVYEFVNGCTKKFNVKDKEGNAQQIEIMFPSGTTNLSTNITINNKTYNVNIINTIEPIINDYYKLYLEHNIGLVLLLNKEMYPKRITINISELDFYLEFNKPKIIRGYQQVLIYFLNDLKLTIAIK